MVRVEPKVTHTLKNRHIHIRVASMYGMDTACLMAGGTYLE